VYLRVTSVRSWVAERYTQLILPPGAVRTERSEAKSKRLHQRDK
jgi:hypothetical protein